MVFIREIKGRKYYYATKRIDGKVKQIFLGSAEPVTLIKSWYIPKWKKEKWKEIQKLRKQFGLPPLKIIQEIVFYDFKTWKRKIKRKRIRI